MPGKYFSGILVIYKLVNAVIPKTSISAGLIHFSFHFSFFYIWYITYKEMVYEKEYRNYHRPFIYH